MFSCRPASCSAAAQGCSAAPAEQCATAAAPGEKPRTAAEQCGTAAEQPWTAPEQLAEQQLKVTNFFFYTKNFLQEGLSDFLYNHFRTKFNFNRPSVRHFTLIYGPF